MWQQNEGGEDTSPVSDLLAEVRELVKAVHSIKLPESKVDNVVKKWDLKVKRGPGGLIRNVEATAAK